MNKFFLLLCCVASAILISACASSGVKANSSLEKKDKELQKPDSVEVSALPAGNPDIAQEAFLRYLYLSHLEEEDLAFEFLKKAVEAEPSNRYLAFTYASSLSDRKMFYEALSIAEPAKKYPGKANGAEYGLLATLYMRMGKADSAKVYFQKAIQENDEDYVKLYEYSLFLEWHQPVDTMELIRVYSLLLPRLNYMRPMFGRLAQLYIDNKQEPAFLQLLEDAFFATKDKEYLLDKVRYYDSQNKKDSVVAVLGRLNQALPEDPDILAMYVDDLLETRSFETAKKVIANYEAEVEDSLRSAVIPFFKGLVSRMMGEYDSSEVYFKEALKDSAVRPSRIYANLSLVAHGKQDTVNAIRYIELADSLEPNVYWQDRIALYYHYQREAELFSYLDLALEQQKKVFENLEVSSLPTDSMIANQPYMAMLEFATGIYVEKALQKTFSNPDSAKALYSKGLFYLEEILSIKPDDSRFIYKKACILERLKRDEEAYAILRDILKKEPSNHLIMNFLGYTLIDRNRSKEDVLEGIALVDSALIHESKNPAYLDSKAWGLYRLGKYAEALELLRYAVTVDKDFLEEYDYWDHLGMVLEAMGDKQMAEECFIKLGEIEPNHPHARFPSKKEP